MSRKPTPLSIPDLSAFSRRLAAQLDRRGAAPSHLELMNMLARAAEFRNYQHLRSALSAKARLDLASDDASIDYNLVEKALRHFDGHGRLANWPSRRQLQILCLWVLWAGLPSERELSERDVNAALNAHHTFGDAALLRREMKDFHLVDRRRDGRLYWRCEKQPPLEAVELIGRIFATRKSQTEVEASA